MVFEGRSVRHRKDFAEKQVSAEDEWLALPFPEKGSIWYELNQSALDAEARVWRTWAH